MSKENVEVRRQEGIIPLQENSLAPDFTALDIDGKTIKLSDFYGKKKVVVYFYPKDFTPGCTTEAAEFASDVLNQVSRKYGVYGVKNFMGREHMGVNRSTFLIDENGIIVKVYPKIKPISGKGFADEYIKIFERIENKENPSIQAK
jgi:peroxiredoxin Q/BCP